MAEGVVENATAINQQNKIVRCYQKLSTFYRAFRFGRSGQLSSNNQGVSSTRDALLRMAAESGGGEDLADLIKEQDFPSLFINGNIVGDTVLHDAAKRGDSSQIHAILNGGEYSGSKNFKEALCRKRNELGNTAMHEAVMMGHVEAVRLVYAADEVVLHYPNKECKSPIYLAIMENRNKQIVDILFPSASSFLYQHIWTQQQQSSSAPAEVAIEEGGKIMQGGQPWNSNPNLQLANCKAKEILSPEFYEAIKERNVYNFPWTLDPEVNQEELYISDIVNEVSPTGDTLLHAAASLGSQATVQFIAFHYPHLIRMKNIMGDTALHVAARSQILHNMIIILTCYAKHSENGFYTDDTETLCSVRNAIGNTALHEAVMINDVEGASLLLSADKVVAHYLNAIGYSPLCRAVLKDYKELVDVLLHAPFINVESHEGNSPLHAAILGSSSGGLMKKILKKKPDLIKQRDQKGGTPLHFAASIGYLEGVRTLVEVSPLSILERNKKGYLPIHVASKRGRVEVVKEIVKQEWVDPLVLLNLKCQNILHIAAKNGKHQVVSYILREKKLDKLLNAGDKNGNAPLHLASKNLFPKVLLLLTQDKRVEVNLANKQRMSSRDVVLIKGSEGSPRGRTVLSSFILHSAGTHIFSKKIARSYRNALPALMEPWLKENNNTLMLVAILVATVTFAAGFTLPGGFISSDDTDPKKRGMAILVNRRMFEVFTICDAVAMYSSTLASVILLWFQLGKDLNGAWTGVSLAVFLVIIALVTMSVAFMAALHMVVVSLPRLARAVIIIGTISLSFLLFGFILLIFPLGCRIPILRHISRFFCRILIPFSGSYGKLPKKKKKKTKELEQQLQNDETRQVTIDMPETQN